ncbi:MAG: hypothetical protein Q3983_04160 [Capnocytophaga sp.]|nr:hypothetical protein [Capnocytophaga sp.]
MEEVRNNTVIDADPFMEYEMKRLMQTYTTPNQIITKLRDLGFSEEEVRQSYIFQYYCEILEKAQKEKKERDAEIRLSLSFIVPFLFFCLFSFASAIGVFFSGYFLFLAIPLVILTYGFYKLNGWSIIIWGILLLLLIIPCIIAFFTDSGKILVAFIPVNTFLLNYLNTLINKMKS